MHKKARKKSVNYDVKTVSLIDLLDQHDAPRLIDYLSIDTEGSEYEIIKDFDFKKYKFSVITVEHGFTKKREDIYRLLVDNGYVRCFQELSRWDDWYVLPSAS
jgi:hypothetical protein